MLLHLAPPVSQDLSVAGKRAGLKHEANGDDETTRSGLFMEAVRIIKEMRKATNGEYPTFAVWENVPGAFSSNNGEDFRTVLQELIKIVEPTAVMPAVPENGWSYADSYCGDGWSLAYRVFDAQYWGVPQRRRRIYLVLDLRGGRAGKILFEREGVRGHFETGRTPGQAVAGDAADRTGEDDCKGAVGFLRQLSGVEAQDEICPTILAASGESGNNKPCVAYTLKIRSGCDGGGKGALIQENKSATLATNNDQYLFQPIAYSFDSLASNSMKSKNPHSGCRQVEIAKTLDTTDPNPCKNQGGIAIIEAYSIERPIVTGVDCRNATEYPEMNGTLQAKSNGGFSYNCNQVVRIQYIVRRLTPTECARLQGFQDNWGHPDHKDDFTDEEYRFWLDVRNTHAAINGKQKKDYTKEQILKWYNKLHTDSSEYKMWGNGISLPTALYVMQGIADALRNEMQ